MQININNNPKINTYYTTKFATNRNVSVPNYKSIDAVSFTSAPVLQKTVTSKIRGEKDKLLKHIKNILETEVPVLTREEKASIMAERAHNLIKYKKKKKREIESEIDILLNSPSLSGRLINERLSQLRKELKRLINERPKEIKETKAPLEDYDYVLLNKIKNAITDNDFNLTQVLHEHYKELETISTVDDLKTKFPKIKVPSNPKDIIARKFANNLTRSFFLKFDELIHANKTEELADIMAVQFEKIYTELAPKLGLKDSEEVHELIGENVIAECIERYQELFKQGSLASIPETRKTNIPEITELDRQLLHVDYDNFVLNTLRKHYLEDLKLNEIEYQNGTQNIKISTLKSPEYKFSKIPEKVKKIITDAKKIKQLQEDYMKYTTNELKTRLNYYATTEFGDNERLLETFIDFNESKFTEEDKQYLIKFLQVLDKINDKKIDLNTAINYIEKNNIRPHGTNKLNEIARKEAEAKLKIEQQRANALNNLKQEFYNAINLLYEIELIDIAEKFSIYTPNSLDEKTVENAKKIIEFIKKSLTKKEPIKIKNFISRIDTYEEYLKTEPDSEIFKLAQKYGNEFNDKEEMCGQYLMNRDFIDDYPENKDLFPYPQILEKIMERFKNDKDTATRLLCKYEDYKTMSAAEQKTILRVLEIFDPKNQDDKLLLKNIIEEEYINSDTIIKKSETPHNYDITIASVAKQAVFDKYKFPKCVDLYQAFEEAAHLKAGDCGNSGVKRTGTNNNALDYSLEIKVKGYPDRLFSKENYNFDVYSERGLH